MSGSFDPVSGRPTGAASTAWSGRGEPLPSGTLRRDRRNSARGRGRWPTVLGLVAGLGLIGAGLIPHGDNGSPARAAAEPTTEPTTTTTAATTTTATTTTATTTTTTTAPAGGWQTIPVHTAIGGSGQIEYQAPPGWEPESAYLIDNVPADLEDYSILQSAAQDTGASCAVQPSGAGVFLDGTTGPSEPQATEYAKGLATIAFGLASQPPTLTVTDSRHVEGKGWIAREVVVHAELADPLDCGLHEGVVTLLALATDADPHRTIMIAAFGGTDSPDGTDEATLRKIVESVSVAS